MKYLIIAIIGILIHFQENENYSLVIRNINLIDGTGGPMQSNVDVYIKNGKIAKIKPTASFKFKSDKIIDGSGKYLIPGLIESHAHSSSIDVDTVKRKNYPHRYKAMIHYGVTSALILGGGSGSYDQMQELQSASASGKIIGPHIYYSSILLTKEGAHPMKTYNSPNYINGKTVLLINDSSDVNKIVKEAKVNGALGIKLIVEDGPMPPFIERISNELIKKVTIAAHSHGLPVFAHISDKEELKACVEAGIDVLAHFAGILLDEQKDRELIKKMAEQKMMVITTTSIVKSLTFYRINPHWLDRPEIVNVYDSQYVSQLKYPGMEDMGRDVLNHFTGGEMINFSSFANLLVKDFIILNEAGVNVALGTDIGGDNFIFAGLSMHEEMETMVLGGINPLEVIKMATLNGAQLLGIENNYGSIETGKYADMIILNQNPLQDIKNTLDIHMVLKDGIQQQRIDQ